MSLVHRQDAPSNSATMGKLGDIEFRNTSYTQFPRQELQVDENYAHERDRAINHNSKDGVKPMTREEQDYERNLNFQLIKKFTMAIFKMDVTCFSFPVGYSEPRTFLERAADLFTFLVDGYLEKASNESDPSKKLALVATGIAAGFHLYLQSKKPWNPVIGETYVGEWENGTRIYGEQTSHHPPVSNLQVICPDKSWKINAQFNFTIDPGVIQVDILQKGLTQLDFDDGTHMEWEFPTICVNGLLRGDRTVKVRGPLIITDTTHNMIYELHVPAKANKKNNVVKPTKTTIWGGAHGAEEKKNHEEYSSIITGDYTSKIMIDDEVVWDINENISKRPLKEIPEEDLLFSDCRYRIDREYLIKGDIDTADRDRKSVV